MKLTRKGKCMIVAAFVLLGIAIFALYRFHQYYYSPMAGVSLDITKSDGAETYYIRLPQYVYEPISPFGVPGWVQDNAETMEKLNLARYKQEYAHHGTYIDFERYKDYGVTVLQIKGEGVNGAGETVALNDIYIVKLKSPFREDMQ